MDENQDWGVPDWRDADQYPATDSLTDREWRWRFLRRRPEYRAGWLAGMRAGKAWHDKVLTDDPDRCEREYGMATLVDPRHEYSDWDLMQQFTPVNVGVGPVSIERSDSWSKSGLYLFRFDLTQAIRPQIVKAEAHLARIQKELYGEQNTPKPRRAQWPLYLRALDAKDVGASYDFMAKTFWPDDYDKKTPQSARDTYKAAVRLRENFPL